MTRIPSETTKYHEMTPEQIREALDRMHEDYEREQRGKNFTSRALDMIIVGAIIGAGLRLLERIL